MTCYGQAMETSNSISNNVNVSGTSGIGYGDGHRARAQVIPVKRDETSTLQACRQI